MPSFGISGNFGITISGAIQSQERSVDQEFATIKGPTGRTEEVLVKPRKITTVTVKSKGVASLSNVAAGTLSGMTITSSKFSETNDDFPTSEVTGTSYA